MITPAKLTNYLEDLLAGCKHSLVLIFLALWALILGCEEDYKNGG